MRITPTLIVSLALSLAPAFCGAQESALPGLRTAAHDTTWQLRFGRALRRAGHFDEAWRVLQGVTGVAAIRNDVLWELARVRFDQGVFQPARAACMSFPAPRGDAAASLRRHVCLGRAYLLWNRVALAEREIAAARAVAPNDPELLLVIADARRQASDLQGAEEAYRAAEAAMPGHNDAALGLGQLYEMFQRPDPAQQQYARALEIDADDPTAAMMIGRFLLRRRERPADAVPHLRRATENRPAWAEALGLYGDALYQTGAWDDALRALQEAARLSPTQPGVQTNLGRTLIALNRFPDAEAPLRLAIQQVDTDANAHMGLADVLEHTGRDTDAMQTWDAAIDRAPGAITPRLRAAQLAHRTHQAALARAYLDRVLTDDPQLAPALYLRGVIAMEQGERTNARQSLTAALAGHGEVDREDIQRRIQELDAPPRVRRR